MAQRCRVTGNALEYVAAIALKKRGLHTNQKTLDKILRLEKDNLLLNDSKERMQSKLTNFLRIYDHLEIPNTSSFAINADSRGSKGESADIVVYEADKVTCRLSIKHNNCSLKHQRPRALHLQLQLNNDLSDTFKTQYYDINDRYYKEWKSKGYENCIDIPFQEKTILYKEINDLTISWLSKDNFAYLKTYLEFLLDFSDNKYIIKYDLHKNKFILLKYEKTITDDISNIKFIQKTSFIYIILKNIVVQMRLHTATTKIIPILSLKYDTTIKHIEELYSIF